MATTLGLHVTAERVDAVAVQANGTKATVQAAFSAPWPKPLAAAHAAELGAWLKQQLAERGLGGGDAAVALGRGLANCRSAVVPECPPEELPGMVRFAAEGQTDAVGDVLDFHAGGLRNGQRDVTLATASQTLLAALQATLKAAGVRGGRIEPRPYSLRWLRERLLEGDAGRPELLVAAAAGGSEASVWIGGRLELHRPLTGSAGEPAARFAAELRRTLVAHEALDGVKLAGVAALAAPANPLAEAARSLGGLPVLAVDPGQKIAGLAEHGADFAAVGAAWRLAAGAATPINFASPKKPQTNTGSRVRIGALAAALCGGLLLAGYYKTQRDLATLGDKAAEFKQQISKAKSVLTGGDAKRKKHEAVKAWIGGQVDWLAELAQLSRLLPDTQDAVVARLTGETSAAKGSTLQLTMQLARPDAWDQALEALSDEPRYIVNPVSSKPLAGNKVFKDEETLDLVLQAEGSAKFAAKAPEPAAKAAPAKTPPAKYDEGLAKAGKRRVPSSFGVPAAMAAASPAAAPGAVAGTGRPRGQGAPRGAPGLPATGTAVPPGAGAAPVAAAPPAADSPENALAEEVKKLALMSYEDREHAIAKKPPILQKAFKKRVEAYLEKNPK